ncbi:hypothetical protein A3770_11p63070 [Chloropicon primus]|uniref:Sfi1 spindle body domain-containing protein n=1 Tax=Chloropicon primus TaxID=1764295 RepID=A0A5B8MSZ4_9CHLO|nr:hypothetical protein A3770_11p63070 [Chloropicon primus]|eukprot:QDZ23789.1 hypothetical protein A3770_11p63070 [Chloropicon primus]
MESFARESFRLYQDKVAKIVVEHWTSFAAGRRAERRYEATLKGRALKGFARSRTEGRTLHRLALVHHASVSYGKYVSKSFDAWREAATRGRSARHLYMCVLARRAVIYLRASLTQWKRRVGERRKWQLVVALNVWAERAQDSSREQEELVSGFRRRRHRKVLDQWRGVASESVAIKKKCKERNDLLCKSTLQLWNRKTKERAQSDTERLQKRLALLAWRHLCRVRSERRKRFADLAQAWRERRRRAAFEAWRASWLAAKDWEVQKRLATTHYVRAASRACLREWRKFCEVVAWVEMKEAHKTRSNMHKIVAEWHRLAFRASDLERRRRIVVSRLYVSRLLKCLQVLQIHKEAMKANVERVLEVYTALEKQALTKAFSAWHDVFLPMRQRKKDLKQRSEKFSKTFLASLAFRSWVSLNSLKALERKAREMLSSNCCTRAFRVWLLAYERRKVKELEDVRRGRALEKLVFGKFVSRVLRSWQKYAYLKGAKKLTLSLAILKHQQGVLRSCIRKAWIPYVCRRRQKKAAIAQADALRARNLTRSGILGFGLNVQRRKEKRLALYKAEKDHLAHVLKAGFHRWVRWIADGKIMKEDEKIAIKKFWKTSASRGIQKLMETGLRRHRSRMQALAVVNAEATRRSMELVEPIARAWRQKARRSAVNRMEKEMPGLGSGSRWYGRGPAPDVSLLAYGGPIHKGSVGISSERDHRELVESTKTALSKFSVLSDSEKKDSNSLREFIMKKSKGRRPPRLVETS